MDSRLPCGGESGSVFLVLARATSRGLIAAPGIELTGAPGRANSVTQDALSLLANSTSSAAARSHRASRRRCAASESRCPDGAAERQAQIRGRGVGQSCPGRGAPGGWALSLIPNTWLGCTPSAHRGSGCVAGTAPAFFFDHDQSGQLQDQVGLLASSATAASTGLSPARSSR